MASHTSLITLADGDPLTPKKPKDLPGNLGTSTDTLIGWSLTGALIAAVLGFLFGCALLAVGYNSERPDMAARGKKSILWSLIAAAGVGTVFGMVKAFFNLGQG
ncbi:hypothetical protein [Streptomyces griseocarneus]|uniref:hypothetical protein n=1 Tax=Streptomyces griseocarneus TaxID=51201 RepID=UPI00167EB6E7|nr:hypothetical protein [Streptomyces griseocarneus]MBZ6475884.1 hypothetical protein [Streptomyces griseocarneus]GHG50220.1 hypothetical protein GCM10018779_10130 [Streptomyces griseocarneus]